MKILFSPVGTSDPWRNDRDGGMLHITRHYQPDLVYLFFTQSLWEGNERLGPWSSFNWEWIIQQVCPTAIVQRHVEAIEAEHDFDSYKDIFHQKLEELKSKYPEAEILLNVTSGTPQMETTLCLEYISYPENKKCIQVSTPLSSANARTKYAEIETVEVDLEIINEEENHAENRCREIQILSFRETMIRSQVKSLIDSYDYEAALMLVRSNKIFPSLRVVRKPLERVTQAIKTHEIFGGLREKYPNNSALQKALFHYLLLDMRFKRKDVAETLIRTKSIAEYIIGTYLKGKYPGLILEGNGKPYLSRNYDPIFIQSYRETQKKKNRDLRFDSILGFPAYNDFLRLLESDNKVLLSGMGKINEINNIRNKVAHNLDNLSLYENQNEKKLNAAVKSVKEMLEYVFPNIDKKDFNYLNNLNERLKEQL